MSQKSRFKMQTQGIFEYRKTFPQLPRGTLHNPKYIQTAHGNRLLIDGWWAYSRKPNYVADWIMSLTWGLCQGFCSPIPYFYSVFFIAVLVHRVSRDFERYATRSFLAPLGTDLLCNSCALKYGKDWERYCQAVPAKFIPGIY